MTDITGPPDDFTGQLKAAAHEVFSMTDIIERLRDTDDLDRSDDLAPLCHKAAAEIERLRAARELMQLDAEKYRDEVERLKSILAIGGNNNAKIAAEIERLREALQEMPDIIKDFDGGNPETSTGWASEEMLDLWMRVCRALEPKP